MKQIKNNSIKKLILSIKEIEVTCINIKFKKNAENCKIMKFNVLLILQLK